MNNIILKLDKFVLFKNLEKSDFSLFFIFFNFTKMQKSAFYQFYKKLKLPKPQLPTPTSQTSEIYMI